MNLIIQALQALQPWAPLAMGALGFGSIHISVFGVARIVRRELAPIKTELVALRKRVAVLEQKPEAGAAPSLAVVPR